jgi:hypothetical protein
MGAWGPGPFDNDDAADFITTLTDAAQGDRAGLVETALILPDGYLEIPEASAAVAVAALVAAANGMRMDMPAEATELMRQGGIPSGADARELARAALARVTGPDSEWRQCRPGY